METVFKEGAIRPEQAVGKPLVIYIHGEKRQIGVITKAVVKDGGIFVAADLNLNPSEDS
jgi:hypothetical protein